MPRGMFANSGVMRKIATPLGSEQQNQFVPKGFKQPLLSKKAKQFFAPSTGVSSARNLTSQPAPQSDATCEYLSPNKLHHSGQKLKQLSTEQFELRKSFNTAGLNKFGGNASKDALQSKAFKDIGSKLPGSSTPTPMPGQTSSIPHLSNMSNPQLIRKGMNATRNNAGSMNNLKELL